MTFSGPKGTYYVDINNPASRPIGTDLAGEILSATGEHPMLAKVDVDSFDHQGEWVIEGGGSRYVAWIVNRSLPIEDRYDRYYPRRQQ